MVNTARTTVFIIVYCIKDSVTNVTKNRRRNTQYFLQYLILQFLQIASKSIVVKQYIHFQERYEFFCFLKFYEL